MKDRKTPPDKDFPSYSQGLDAGWWGLKPVQPVNVTSPPGPPGPRPWETGTNSAGSGRAAP